MSCNWLSVPSSNPRPAPAVRAAGTAETVVKYRGSICSAGLVVAGWLRCVPPLTKATNPASVEISHPPQLWPSHFPHTTPSVRKLYYLPPKNYFSSFYFTVFKIPRRSNSNPQINGNQKKLGQSQETTIHQSFVPVLIIICPCQLIIVEINNQPRNCSFLILNNLCLSRFTVSLVQIGFHNSDGWSCNRNLWFTDWKPQWAFSAFGDDKDRTKDNDLCILFIFSLPCWISNYIY